MNRSEIAAGSRKPGEGDVLVAEGLTVRVGGKALIGPADLRIAAGERVGVLGPSGCGKSQLLDRLMGLAPLKSGDGRIETPGGRFALSAVFQTNALFDTLTVRENVAMGAEASRAEALGAGGAPRARDGGEASDARERAGGGEVDELIRGMGLDPARDGDKFPVELSGGMQRRVALARALRARPALLVLDEPLVGLDGESRRIVQRTVEAAHRDSGGTMAILVVTHDYDFAASFCDRMLWIDPKGRSLLEIPEWPKASEPDRERLIMRRLRGDDEGAARSQPGTAELPSRPRGLVGRVVFDQWTQFGEMVRSIVGSAGEIPGLIAGFLHGPGGGARPGRDFLEHWLRSCILAVPYVALLFALLGLLMVFQSERLLAPIGLASRIPEAVTLGVVQGFGPLLLALIMAGRTGSAMAADLGGQRLSRQVEMWTLLGRDPRSVLFAPRAWALVIAFPLLLLLSEFIALGAGWLFYSVMPQTGITARAFWVGVGEAWELAPTLGGMARTALDGGVLAVIAYFFGTAPKRGAEDVADASTQTVVVSSLAFLVIEVAWTVLLGVG